jgi:hypothetical protein
MESGLKHWCQFYYGKKNCKEIFMRKKREREEKICGFDLAI